MSAGDRLSLQRMPTTETVCIRPGLRLLDRPESISDQRRHSKPSESPAFYVDRGADASLKQRGPRAAEVGTQRGGTKASEIN